MKYSIPIVDFHSHILPFVDHGSASPEASEFLLTQAKKAGVATIVATPHFYPSQQPLDSFLSARQAGYDALSDHLSKKGLTDISIVPGAEVALEKELRELSDLSSLAIQGTNHILIEMPLFTRWQGWMYDYLYEIQTAHGLRVILAHVDRYPLEMTERLLDRGFTAQVNASSLVKGRARDRLLARCAEGSIHLIGSDAHDIKERNYADMIRARKRLGEDMLAYFHMNACEILED